MIKSEQVKNRFGKYKKIPVLNNLKYLSNIGRNPEALYLVTVSSNTASSKYCAPPNIIIQRGISNIWNVL